MSICAGENMRVMDLLFGWADSDWGWEAEAEADAEDLRVEAVEESALEVEKDRDRGADPRLTEGETEGAVPVRARGAEPRLATAPQTRLLDTDTDPGPERVGGEVCTGSCSGSGSGFDSGSDSGSGEEDDEEVRVVGAATGGIAWNKSTGCA